MKIDASMASSLSPGHCHSLAPNYFLQISECFPDLCTYKCIVSGAIVMLKRDKWPTLAVAWQALDQAWCKSHSQPTAHCCSQCRRTGRGRDFIEIHDNLSVIHEYYCTFVIRRVASLRCLVESCVSWSVELELLCGLAAAQAAGCLSKACQPLCLSTIAQTHRRVDLIDAAIFTAIFAD